MPCRFRYVAAHHLLIQHIIGAPALPEVLAHYDAMLGHPALPETRLELTDMRRMDGFGFDSRTLGNLVTMLSVEYLRRSATFQRGAVIVAAGPGEFAARLFQEALPPAIAPRYAVLRDAKAAIAWLKLDGCGQD